MMGGLPEIQSYDPETKQERVVNDNLNRQEDVQEMSLLIQSNQMVSYNPL